MAWGVRNLISTQVEDRDSAFWAGIARRRAATEARWAEKRKAHALTGLGGTFNRHETEFVGVVYVTGRYLVQVDVGSNSRVHMMYRDVHVAALAVDIALVACGRAALNYPKRGFCLAASPPTDVVDALMRKVEAAARGPAAGGGPTTRVVLRETAAQYCVRSVVTRTLGCELARIREAEVRRLLVELRERTGVLDDDVYDELAARVDALDLERMLGDRLRAEGFAEPPGDGRGRAAAGKKRGRASSDDDDSALPAPTGQWRSRAERAAQRVKPDA